jgi:lysophospholipase L1-like esterase
MSSSDPEPARPLLVLTGRARRRLLGLAGTVLGLLALPYVVPPLNDLAPWHPGGDYVPFWNVVARQEAEQVERAERAQVEGFEELALSAEEAPPEEPPRAEEVAVPSSKAPTPPVGGEAPRDVPRVFPGYAAHPDEAGKVETELENPEALAHYFGQLTLTDLKLPGAITRAGQWGDSVLGGDGLTYALRQHLQARFGDAGHGFHDMSRYSVGYMHRGVRFQDRGGWRTCEIIFKCRPDAHYGYGGVSSVGPPGAESMWQTSKQAPGDRVSRFELWYAKAPDGARFQVKIDGAEPRVVDTHGPKLQDAVAVFPVPDGPHSFEVKTVGEGLARGYGVVLEREGPGVVWDELSLIGSFTQRLDYQNRAHLGWQLRRRNVDLMVFIFGGNDVQREFDDLRTQMLPYENEYNRVIAKFRAGRPEASCLVMSLIDHGQRVDNTVRTRGIVPRLVSSQRKVAEAQGCAFFDTFHAMGGMDSIGRWFQARPQLAAPDFSHPSAAGQAVIATLFYRALMKSYGEYRTRMSGEPLPALSVYNESDAVAERSLEADAPEAPSEPGPVDAPLGESPSPEAARSPEPSELR